MSPVFQTFAVSCVLERPDGVLEQRLAVLEAKCQDVAEAHVLTGALVDGRQLRGLQTLPVSALDAADAPL